MACAEWKNNNEHKDHLCGYCVTDLRLCKNCDVNQMWDDKGAKCNFMKK